MPNYSLNNDAPEPDRSLIDRGYNGLNETSPPTSYENSGGEVPPNQLTHPLTNAVNPSSDTSTRPLGPGVQETLVR